MADYRRNHYVPEWYQYRFIPEEQKDKKFFYLDLRPQAVSSNGHYFKRSAMLRWGPPRCFYQTDLYTTKFGSWESTEIEQEFFGKVDSRGLRAVEYFSTFEHPDVNPEAFQDLLRYMSIQKLRTPKGLAFLRSITKTKEKNETLFHLQELQDMFCAIWSECVWQIADANQSSVKFIISDHPVTVYNKACFPASKWCGEIHDPDIRLSGTHTYFPLSANKILILTNMSWVRHPYGNPLKPRPNPRFFRQAMFNFLGIQTHRSMSDAEVNAINFITKSRAYRYIAATNKDWLFPEVSLKSKMWNRFGDSFLLMPDPRSVSFSTEVIIGYENSPADIFDEYGRRPGHKDFGDKQRGRKEWETFHAFQGEFARLFGAKRRGRSFEFSRLCDEEDNPDFHNYHLSLEQKFKKYRHGTN